MHHINIDDIRVKRAITFVEDHVKLCREQSPESFLEAPIEVPWIYHSPAITSEEKVERSLLIRKYGQSQQTEVRYYLYYHGCDEFAIFYWTALSVNGITAKIVRQDIPFPHTYLKKESGEIVDALLSYCNVVYPYSKDAKEFDTPYDFYSEVFISKENRKEWEDDLLIKLRELEAEEDLL